VFVGVLVGVVVGVLVKVTVGVGVGVGVFVGVCVRAGVGLLVKQKQALLKFLYQSFESAIFYKFLLFISMVLFHCQKHQH